MSEKQLSSQMKWNKNSEKDSNKKFYKWEQKLFIVGFFMCYGYWIHEVFSWDTNIER